MSSENKTKVTVSTEYLRRAIFGTDLLVDITDIKLNNDYVEFHIQGTDVPDNAENCFLQIRESRKTYILTRRRL